MTDYEIIKTALEIAKDSHKGQKDKAGCEYIYHPITVALLCESTKAKAVALLHDTIEDTDITYEQIKEKLGEEIADAVNLLTNNDDGTSGDKLENYLSYVQRIKDSENELAIAVKKADLTMNNDISRIPNPTEKDYERIKKKYEPAFRIIEE